VTWSGYRVAGLTKATSTPWYALFADATVRGFEVDQLVVLSSAEAKRGGSSTVRTGSTTRVQD
jgi:hypothetical protein